MASFDHDTDSLGNLFWMRDLSAEERSALAAAWADLRSSLYLVIEADSVTFALAYLRGAARSLEGAAKSAIQARGTIARPKRPL